jgi:hypothetical protein
MRQVHPLTDAHSAGVIHSLREIKATKAAWSGWLGPESTVHIDSADSPYCPGFDLRESQFGSSGTADQQDVTKGRVTLAAHATASGA